MCGIAGEWRFDGKPVKEERLYRAASLLAHRGPDGEGIWHSGSVGFVHRRLSLVDLSPAGAQPMVSTDENFVVTFNGEIYNYQFLREELLREGVIFRSTSDTEVLLHLYARDGERMLERLRGMFAFAIWDQQRRCLFFARDRIGKKPFFYHLTPQHFSFASELKALIVSEKPEIDWEAIRLFFGLQYIPSPRTGFMGIASLLPGHYGIVQADGRLSIHAYHVATRLPKTDIGFEEAAKEVRRLLEESVRLRLIADVPVGVFLSGGMDSSAIACLAARVSEKPLQTFTMGFASAGFDERDEAKKLANHLQAEPHTFEARPEDAVKAADTVLALYDAPFADSSAIPSWLLCRETAKDIKAVMAGDGGDELFGGYRRYQAFLKADLLTRWHLGGVMAFGSDIAYRVWRDARYQRFARTIRARQSSFADGYAALFTGSYFSREDEMKLLQPAFLEQTASYTAHRFIIQAYHEALGIEGVMDFDLTHYLADDLNVKMDRAGMAHGLEVRCPLLDQELVAFVARLPTSYQLRLGEQKPLLRAALQNVVLEEVFTRPKRGFQVPLAKWFRGTLRPMFIERCLVQESPLSVVCRSEEVKRYLEENDRGVDHGNRLWMLYALATWLAYQK